MTSSLYLIALGSNQRHARLGSPRSLVKKAAELLDETVGEVLAMSSVMISDPIGPSLRRYANAALILESDLSPPQLLQCLQYTESQLGRERRGQRWRSRTMDLDIVLWSGGIWASEGLKIPHPMMRERDFVLGPAMQIAGDWRDPVSTVSVRHLFARLTRAKPIPR